MLQAIRDKTQSWISIVIIGFLILMFGMWGISYYLSASSVGTQEAVKVNGQSIPLQSFQSLYNLERQAAADQVNSGQLSLSDLKSLILNSLIQNELLYQGAVSAGLGLSIKTIDSYIISMPQFQDHGIFSQALYQNYLQRENLTTDGLRQKLQQNILINQWQLGFSQTDFVLPKEVQQYSDWDNQKRQIEWTAIPESLGNTPVPTVTLAEEKKYYDQHLALMMAPERVKLDYLILSLSDLKKKLTASNNSHQTDQQIEQTAEEQYADLGNQLANLTFENPQSLDPAASQLGLTVQHSGWISRDAKSAMTDQATRFLINQAVLNSAFSKDLIQSGQNSDPINLNNLNNPNQPNDQSVVILRVTAHEAPQLKSFSDPSVQSQCKDAVIKQKQEVQLQAVANLVLAGKYQGPALTKQTAVISRDEAPSKISGLIISGGFNLSLSQPMQLIQLSDGSYAVVKLIKILPPSAQNNDIKKLTSLAQSLRQERATSDQIQYLANLKTKAKITLNPSLTSAQSTQTGS